MEDEIMMKNYIYLSHKLCLVMDLKSFNENVSKFKIVHLSFFMESVLRSRHSFKLVNKEADTIVTTVYVTYPRGDFNLSFMNVF